MNQNSRQTNQALESQVREISKVIRDKGFIVRRENLARGHSFRVKSGNCKLLGRNIIFVDKRLPLDQQHSLLADYLAQLPA